MIAAEMLSPAALLRECQTEAFHCAEVDKLARVAVTLRHTPPAALDDRALAHAINVCRTVRSRLERHRQLEAGVL